MLCREGGHIVKKVLPWIGIVLSAIGLGALIRFGIPALLYIFIIHGLEYEHAAMNDNAESALRETGLTAYTEYATWHDLTIDGVITAFELPKYDNHVDNTNLWAGVMSLAAAHHNHWQVESVTAGEYISLLKTHLPEAAFLYPAADLVFDAKCVNMTGSTPAELAFFDQDTGLMIYLCTYVQQPQTGSITADKLSVPHNGYVYETETHGGFLGDGTTYRAFIVPEAERASLEATLAAHADWHAGAITRAEYIHLHNHEFYSVPGLYPTDDVTFDWWCYVNTYARAHPDFVSEYTPDNSDFPAVMQQAGARPAGNWLVALYDPDTGLFIYYEYDS